MTATPDRKLSFGTEAAAYAEHRPGYPLAGIRWALAGRTPAAVLDLAAGTGKLTAALTGLGLAVVAVEPDDAMRAELHRALPDVPAHPGRAEAIPLPDDSVDAVFVGEALHWFDLDRALPEVDRVLRPGGVLVALWNTPDHRQAPWLTGLFRLVGEEHVLGTPPTGDRAHPPFGRPEFAEFRHTQRRTAASLTATFGTHSSRLILPPPERAAALTRIHAYLTARPETAAGEFDLPLSVVVARYTRS